MAEILPFPLARRRAFIRKHALHVCYYLSAPGAGDRHIRRQLEIQREALLGRGVETAAVNVEIASLERAIRAEIARLNDYSEVGA